MYRKHVQRLMIFYVAIIPSVGLEMYCVFFHRDACPAQVQNWAEVSNAFLLVFVYLGLKSLGASRWQDILWRDVDFAAGSLLEDVVFVSDVTLTNPSTACTVVDNSIDDSASGHSIASVVGIVSSASSCQLFGNNECTESGVTGASATLLSEPTERKEA